MKNIVHRMRTYVLRLLKYISNVLMSLPHTTLPTRAVLSQYCFRSQSLILLICKHWEKYMRTYDSSRWIASLSLIRLNWMSKYLIKWVKLLKLAAVMSKTAILDELNYSHYGSLRNCREHFHEQNSTRLPKEKLHPRTNYHATLVP